MSFFKVDSCNMLVFSCNDNFNYGDLLDQLEDEEDVVFDQENRKCLFSIDSFLEVFKVFCGRRFNFKYFCVQVSKFVNVLGLGMMFLFLIIQFVGFIVE